MLVLLAGWPCFRLVVGLFSWIVGLAIGSTNNITKLIGGNAKHKQKKSRDVSRDNTTIIWRSKKLYFWNNYKKILT